MTFIQLPDLGADLSHVGKRAKRVNGKANANAKPSIPTVGPTTEPDVAISTSRKPMIGPVQEKLTSANVNAMRKIDSRPLVFPALESTALLQDDGNVISNPPRNEAAKTSNIRQKNILNTALVDSELRALAPKRSVTARPRTT